MDDKYYVCKGEQGVSVWDNISGSMLSMNTSADKSHWLKFTLTEAKEVAAFRGYEIIKVEMTEEGDKACEES